MTMTCPGVCDLVGFQFVTWMSAFVTSLILRTKVPHFLLVEPGKRVTMVVPRSKRKQVLGEAGLYLHAQVPVSCPLDNNGVGVLFPVAEEGVPAWAELLRERSEIAFTVSVQPGQLRIFLPEPLRTEVLPILSKYGECQLVG
jgi:hypothetical protein